MLEYLVLNEDGNEVKTGSTITDFRGQEAIFLEVTRGVEYNGTAKVRVEWPSVEGKYVAGNSEYYARVFGLKVQTKCGVQGCGSVDHSTRDHGAELRH
jgi:hypothetical protein